MHIGTVIKGTPKWYALRTQIFGHVNSEENSHDHNIEGSFQTEVFKTGHIMLKDFKGNNWWTLHTHDSLPQFFVQQRWLFNGHGMMTQKRIPRNKFWDPYSLWSQQCSHSSKGLGHQNKTLVHPWWAVLLLSIANIKISRCQSCCMSSSPYMMHTINIILCLYYQYLK